MICSPRRVNTELTRQVSRQVPEFNSHVCRSTSIDCDGETPRSPSWKVVSTYEVPPAAFGPPDDATEGNVVGSPRWLEGLQPFAKKLASRPHNDMAQVELTRTCSLSKSLY